MAHPYQLRFSDEDKLQLIAALPEDSELRKRFEDVRDRTKSPIAVHEFRGLYCKHCDEQTPHRRKYKTKERFVCDECVKPN